MQFRELEFLLGYKRQSMLRFHPEGSPAHQAIMKRLGEPSLVDHFYVFLEKRGVTIPEKLRQKPIAQETIPDTTVQAGALKLYRKAPEVAILFELMMDFDEGFQEWRYRHIKLVERTIGNKKGTGGSLGVDFLKKSLFTTLFPDLWATRNEL